MIFSDDVLALIVFVASEEVINLIKKLAEITPRWPNGFSNAMNNGFLYFQAISYKQIFTLVTRIDQNKNNQQKRNISNPKFRQTNYHIDAAVAATNLSNLELHVKILCICRMQWGMRLEIGTMTVIWNGSLLPSSTMRLTAKLLDACLATKETSCSRISEKGSSTMCLTL